MNPNKKHIIFSLVVGASIAFGYMLAVFLGASNSSQLPQQQTGKLSSLFQLIETQYVDSVKLSELEEELIPLVLEKLDPHSTYIAKEEFNEYNDPIKGSFEGVGIQFDIKNDTIVVVQVIAGGPSEKVQIKAGDRIITVNKKVVAGTKLTSDRVLKLLKGPKGTKVSVGIKRKNHAKLIDFTITRDKIPMYSIDASYMLSKSIGYIKINKFSSTTKEEFITHITKLRALGMKKVVIDLRENGGGLLNTAIFLANEFLNKNDLIVYTQGKAFKREDFPADGKGSCRDLQLAVLLNEYSASASEVFAGAIQDNDRGVIIGRRSFGKGLVNRDYMFADSSSVRLTIQKFYSPSGRCIQKPFNKGKDEYEKDLVNRLLHGELQAKDSIVLPKHLRYKTKKGKMVYGGGGIMPDYFIPMDSIGYTEYFAELENKGIINDFAFDIADKHRSQLLQCKTISQCVAYCNNQQLLQKLFAYATNNGIAYNAKDIGLSKNVIQKRLYAYIIRNVFSNEMFYEYLQQNEPEIIKAVEVLGM